MELHVRSLDDVDRHLSAVHAAAAKTQTWIAAHDGSPMDLLRAMKFETIGFHPVADHALNVVEQINQTFTYAVALAAARTLLVRHPDAGGFVLAPGAHMSRPLDIMSETDGLVGAETFAAVTPGNNGKLAADLAKLASRPERYRYVFFASPRFPGTNRLQKFERDGVEVWSVDV
ncbi:hypothetical protein U0C82_18295 [Fulvimarina sp. 2208YS6-2-32]|uniref:Uncharacterized protein n=1 Tax=Fulvimarina uroteuthidis TaxID=3098149 RepID=A0ABU5I6R2_9HYPH|nr:hypothetical protein [Fulvimarina sp. 2208YS6-2-32]MDY8111077.1 hypothetical protein [Fulvimarina sp. 2208YS6-2-32]